MKRILLYLSLLSFFLFWGGACKKTKPQIPSNKKTAIDLKEQQYQINQELILCEDSLLSLYVETLGDEYKKSDLGFWYKKESENKGELLKKNDVCSISFRISLLDGTLVEEKKDIKINVARKETIKGIDLALLLLRRGESASFLFPSSLAYGMRGYDTLVPAYTPVFCFFEVGEN